MSEKIDLTKYQGKWAAIFDDEIVASDENSEKLFEKIEELEIKKEEISIILVPEEDESHHIL